ncbi:unnamed protein product [Pleuronectes platessa]|uniref:Uncharacterized protein n=1 Tax=Pleuronectes platessa TaxID=8262 RepID=A0A9N7V9I1_PLEPL|nr:unnamed protein product [Pleuronectes platessa]
MTIRVNVKMEHFTRGLMPCSYGEPTTMNLCLAGPHTRSICSLTVRHKDVYLSRSFEEMQRQMGSRRWQAAVPSDSLKLAVLTIPAEWQRTWLCADPGSCGVERSSSNLKRRVAASNNLQLSKNKGGRDRDIRESTVPLVLRAHPNTPKT